VPIQSSDIRFRLSGGASQAIQANSLGGVRSSVAATGSIFDTVSGVEARDGDTEFRCIYPTNTHATLTLANAVFWITANTPLAATDVAAGLGTSVGGTEQTIPNENTAPAGVTFTAAGSKSIGIPLGDLAPGASRAVWIRRTVNAGTGAATSDTFTLRAEGETA
jgi:hypothetical protein